MSVPNPRTCPSCKTTIPAGFPTGMCPKCLLGSASSTDAIDSENLEKEISAPSGKPPHSAHIPSLDTLRSAFPDLEIIEILGAGGMGAVYKARQPRLDRFVALKIMTCKPGHEVDFALRFEREAQVLARLSHPNIVIIYDFGDLDKTRTGGDPLFYFIMEYVDGTDLAQLIRVGDMKAPQALAIVPQICEALQYAHDQGITHRDIKPANILIDQRCVVKIADFGLAKMARANEPHFQTGLTQTGTTLGTPHYMAPEQWENPDLVDHRADIYALGVVFYEMLTGERPAGVFEPPSKKSSLNKKLDGVVLRAMERNPDRRYQQASEIKSDVTRIAEKESEPPHSYQFKKLYSLGIGAALLAGSWFYFQDVLKPRGGQDPLLLKATTLSTTPLQPGRLRAVGVTSNGQPHDLSKFDQYHDFIDVAGGWHDWTALRANGETLSSNGKSDYKDIKRIVNGLLGVYAFIDKDNQLVMPQGFPIAPPQPLQKTAIVDAAFGRDHGLLLTTEKTAIPYGKRYEETIGDWKDPTQWDTPRWPAPPEHGLRNVIDIAVTSTHAATLNKNGEVTLWGWEGVTTWSLEPNIKRVINIESDDDTLWLLDEAGQVWSYHLPRSPSAHKMVLFDHKLKFAAADVAQLRQRFWCYHDGSWRSNQSEANLKWSELSLKPQSGFSISSGTLNGKQANAVLWIEPEHLAPPPFTDREAALWALTSVNRSRPWADGEDMSVIVRLIDGNLRTIRKVDELPKEAFTVTGISCVPSAEQRKDFSMVAHITDDQVQRLSQLKHLEHLHLYSKTTRGVLNLLSSFPSLKTASLSAQQFTASDLTLLRDSPLISLRFFELPVQAQSSLEVLATLPRLRELTFEGPFDLALARALPQLPLLTKFSTSQNDLMTDAMLPILVEKFPNLKALSLVRCRNIQGATFKDLHSWTKLSSLTLTDTPVGDTAIPALRGMQSLTNLHLGYTRITDASLLTVTSLPLVTLTVSESQITDEGIARLAQIPSLKKLSATNYQQSTGFTAMGVDRFQKLRPEVEVNRSPTTALVKTGKLTALGSLRAGKPIDLNKAEGITDFKQVVLHDKGWVALRANGQTVSSDGRGERKNIVQICPGIETAFALIDDQDHVEVFARLERTEDLNASLPSDMQQIGVVNLLTDGHHSLALLKDGTARAWGNHYDHPNVVPEWLGREPWTRPPEDALIKVRSIAITPFSASTVTDDGRLWIWGKPSYLKIPANALSLQGQYASLVSSNSGLYDALTRDGSRVSFNLSTREATVGSPGIVASAYGGYRPLHQRIEGEWSTAWKLPGFQPYFDAIRKRPASAFSLMFFHEGDDRISVGLLRIDPIE